MERRIMNVLRSATVSHRHLRLVMRRVAPFPWRRFVIVEGPASRQAVQEQLRAVHTVWSAAPRAISSDTSVLLFIRGRTVSLSASDRSTAFACVANNRGYSRQAAAFSIVLSRLQQEGRRLPLLATRTQLAGVTPRCLRSLGVERG